jgi:hypothetical protein
MKKARKATPAVLKEMAKAPVERQRRDVPDKDCCRTQAGRRRPVVWFYRGYTAVFASAFHDCGIEILEVKVYEKKGYSWGTVVSSGSAGGCQKGVAVTVAFRRRPGKRYYAAYTVADCCRHVRSTFFLAI